MALKRLNYDKLIAGAVTNVLPTSQYAQFSGYNALVGGAAFTQYDADIAKNESIATTRTGNISFNLGGPSYGAARLTGQATPYETTASGQTAPRGSFTTGPNIKRLSISNLVSAGRLPYATVSSVTDALPGGGTTGVEGLGVTQAAGLTFTELQGLRDIAYESATRNVPKIPLTGSADIDLATIPYQTQRNISALIGQTQIGKSGPTEYIVTPGVQSTEAKSLFNLPMPSFYQPEAKAPTLTNYQSTQLQKSGVINVQPLKLPSLETPTYTSPGELYYAAIRELSGQFKAGQLSYTYKSPSTGQIRTSSFNLTSPKPILLPR